MIKSLLIGYLCAGLSVETGDRTWLLAAIFWLLLAVVEFAVWVSESDWWAGR
jgi:hypothetical protein